MDMESWFIQVFKPLVLSQDYDRNVKDVSTIRNFKINV